jgi:hypothetical protein
VIAGTVFVAHEHALVAAVPCMDAMCTSQVGT